MAALYTVMASLPHLPYFERAAQLPLSEIQLDRRIGMLEPGMRDLTRRINRFLSWHYHSSTVTNSHIAREYEAVIGLCAPYEGVRHLIEATMRQRTIVAALRLRRDGIAPAEAGRDWGVGDVRRHIERHWHEEDFRLGRRHPWMAEVKRYMEEEQPLEMERLFLRLNWKRAERLAWPAPFEYGALIAYLFRWGLIQKWLGYGPTGAANRFTSLISEVVGEYKTARPLFV